MNTTREDGVNGAHDAVPGLEPMYATIGRAIPEGEEWVFEPKYDGVRVLAFADPAGIRLVTRNGREKTEQFPEVVDALRRLAAAGAAPLVLDGEIVAMRGGQPARFQTLQDRVHLKDPKAIAGASEKSPAALVAFDLLVDEGRSLVAEPWETRRAALERRLSGRGVGSILLGEVLELSGERGLRWAREHGWEGVIAKRRDARYQPGRRSDHWLKLKVEFRQEFVVGGWTDPQRSRPHLGSLLVAYHLGEQLVFAGGVGTGFNREGLRVMRERLEPLALREPPFRDPPRPRTAVHWVQPQVVVELKFAEWTADGLLRQPVFLGVRDDKDPRDVTREATSAQRA